jgi:hypothetical protein
MRGIENMALELYHVNFITYNCIDVPAERLHEGCDIFITAIFSLFEPHCFYLTQRRKGAKEERKEQDCGLNT